MNPIPKLVLKKGEHRRIRAGHPWIYSNEIDTNQSPLKSFTKGQTVIVHAQDGTVLGVAYVNPHSLIAARLYSTNPNQVIDQAFFEERLAAAKLLRDRLFTKPFYRLIFSEADLLPGVIIDRFGEHFVIQINTAGMDNHKQPLVAALLKVFPETVSVLFRNDSPIRIQEGLECEVTAAFGTPPENVTLFENDVQFTAPLTTGQKTGWFYDHRLNRARTKNYVKDQRVLDVFSYAGGWGIQAAVFGATQVDCIEVSSLAARYIEDNAKLNQVENKVTVICDDAFDAMKNLLQAGKQYDVITLDPPAFVKKAKDLKEGLLAYQRINELAVKLLAPNGILFSCSCSMHVSMEALTEVLARVAARTQTSLQLLERGHQGPDHPIHLAIPESEYLKAIVVRKIG